MFYEWCVGWDVGVFKIGNIIEVNYSFGCENMLIYFWIMFFGGSVFGEQIFISEDGKYEVIVSCGNCEVIDDFLECKDFFIIIVDNVDFVIGIFIVGIDILGMNVFQLRVIGVLFNGVLLVFQLVLVIGSVEQIVIDID